MTPEVIGIKGYKREYMVYSDGRIYSVRRCKFLSLNSRNGYLVCSLSKANRPKTVTVHRVVAQHFVPNPNKFKEVNHKNGNKKDNRSANLEWTDRIGNVKHAIKTGLFVPHKNNRPDVSIKVNQMTLDGKFIQSFPSINEAGRVLKKSSRWIAVCLKGGCYIKQNGIYKWIKRNSAYGFRWQQVKTHIQQL